MKIALIRRTILNQLKRVIDLPRSLLEKLGRWPSASDLERYLSWAEKRRDTYLTSHERPKRSTSVGTRSDYSADNTASTVSIVMQGPVVREDDFTLETARTYRKLYPDARIYLSTWEQERGPYLDEFRSSGIEVLYNPMPDTSGYWNVNYQIVSSLAGLNHAKEKGATFLLKTRSDQRFYAANMISFLMGLVQAFPLGEETVGKQKGRLVGLSLGTCKYRAYALSDMFLFGYSDDVVRYWSQPLDGRSHAKREFSTMRQEISFRAPEIYLLENYLKFHEQSLQFTLEDWWEILAKRFCIVDTETVDLCWRKYKPHEEFRYREYGANRTSEMIGFKEWLLLYIGRPPSNNQSNILDMAFGARLESPS